MGTPRGSTGHGVVATCACRGAGEEVFPLGRRRHLEALQRSRGDLGDLGLRGPKLDVFKDLVEHLARARAHRGELAFGTVDTWLLWQLTQGKVHATDVSNASRTLLFNIHTLRWDDTLLDLLQIPRALYDELVAHALADENEVCGLVAGRDGVATRWT